MSSNKASRNLKKYEAQDSKCYLCGEEMLPPGQHSNHPKCTTRDHVFPKSPRKGNKKRYNHSQNILLSHRECNMNKGSREPYPCELIYLEAINKKIGQ